MYASGQANRIDVLLKFEINAFICILKVTQLNQRRVRCPADPLDVKEIVQLTKWRSMSTRPCWPNGDQRVFDLPLTRATQLTNSRGKTTRPSLSKTQLTQLTSGGEKVRYPAEAFADNNCATHLTGEVKEYASQLTHVVRPGVLLAQGRDRDEEDQLRHWQDDQEVLSFPLSHSHDSPWLCQEAIIDVTHLHLPIATCWASRIFA
jgi:hypothetical protein